MARYRRSTTTTTSIIQGVPSTIDTIQELASFVNDHAIIDVDVEGLELIVSRNNSVQDVIDLTPIATGEVSALTIVGARLENKTLFLQKSDETEISLDLSPLSFVILPELVDNVLTFTDSLGSTISIDLTTYDQTSDINSLSTRITDEELARIEGDNSLSEVILSMNQSLASKVDETYDDSSLVTRISTVEDTVESSVTSIDDKINNISIPQGFDESSLETRISLVEDVTIPTDVSDLTDNGGLLTHPTYNDSSLETRLSQEEDSRTSSVSSLDVRFDNISSSTYNDSSLNTRVSSLESTVDGISVTPEFDPSSIEERISVEKVGRLAGDNSLTTAVSSLDTRLNDITDSSYDDSSVVNRLSTEEVSRYSGDVSLTSRVSSLESTVDGISIPTEFDDTSLTTRVSSLESTVNGISIPTEYDDSSIEVRVSSNESSVTSIDTRLTNLSGSIYDDTSINSRVSSGESLTTNISTELASLSIPTEYNDVSLNTRVSSLESTVDSISIPTEFDDSSLTTRVSNLEVIHNLDEQSINNEISVNNSAIASLDTRVDNIDPNELNGTTLNGDVLTVSGTNQNFSVDLGLSDFVTQSSLSSDLSTLNSLIGGLQTVISSQQSTINSLDVKVQECCDSSTTQTTTQAPVAPTTTSTTTTQTPTTTTSTTLGDPQSYLLYADAGPGPGQVLYNSSNGQFYPFLVQNAPTTFDNFVSDRLNNSDRITIFNHDVCVDKSTVTYSLNYNGESTSSTQVQAFYLHPSSMGTVTEILDTNTNAVYGVTPATGQDITINGVSYKIYRWLNPQADGTTFSIKVNNCL